MSETIDVGPVSCPSCKRPYAPARSSQGVLSESERALVDGYRYAWGSTSPASPLLDIIDRLASPLPPEEGPER